MSTNTQKPPATASGSNIAVGRSVAGDVGTSRNGPDDATRVPGGRSPHHPRCSRLRPHLIRPRPRLGPPLPRRRRPPPLRRPHPHFQRASAGNVLRLHSHHRRSYNGVQDSAVGQAVAEVRPPSSPPDRAWPRDFGGLRRLQVPRRRHPSRHGQLALLAGHAHHLPLRVAVGVRVRELLVSGGVGGDEDHAAAGARVGGGGGVSDDGVHRGDGAGADGRGAGGGIAGHQLHRTLHAALCGGRQRLRRPSQGLLIPPNITILKYSLFFF